MSRCRSLSKQLSGALGVPVLLAYKTAFCSGLATKCFRGRGAWTKRENASPRRDKRGATARPLPTVPGRTYRFGRASEWLQRRSLKTQEFFSSSTNDVPADFVLSLRRFVSHRNVGLLRTRRTYGIDRRQRASLFSPRFVAGL
jgi:hypothetical protein